MNKMNLEQAVNILKQVVDLGVVKGGLFSNAKEVTIVNMAMEVVEKHCTPVTEGPQNSKDIGEKAMKDAIKQSPKSLKKLNHNEAI